MWQKLAINFLVFQIFINIWYNNNYFSCPNELCMYNFPCFFGLNSFCLPSIKYNSQLYSSKTLHMHKTYRNFIKFIDSFPLFLKNATSILPDKKYKWNPNLYNNLIKLPLTMNENPKTGQGYNTISMRATRTRQF